METATVNKNEDSDLLFEESVTFESLRKTLEEMIEVPEDLPLGYIYRIHCTVTEKSYVGQCAGPVAKRFIEHCGDNKTQIDKEINKLGADKFIIETLLECPAVYLSAYESWFIQMLDTMYPKGYNVQRHSRVRGDISIAALLIRTTTSIEVVPIKANGVNRLVRVLFTRPTISDTRLRIMFGQGTTTNFQEAISDAQDFIRPFEEIGVPINVHPEILGVEDHLSKYYKEIGWYDDKDIIKVTFGVWHQKKYDQVIVKVFTADQDSYRRHSFGGVTLDVHDSLAIAEEFVGRLPITKETEIKFEKSVKVIGIKQ